MVAQARQAERRRMTGKPHQTERDFQRAVRVMGIDPGTANLGWAVVEGERVLAGGRMGSQAAVPLDRRIIGLVGSLVALARAWEITEVAIEDYQHGDREGVRHSARGMQRLIGALIVACELAGFSTALYAPQVWQTSIVGRRRRKHEKSDVMRALKLRRVRGLEHLTTEHARDAAAVALHHLSVRRLQQGRQPAA